VKGWTLHHSGGETTLDRSGFRGRWDVRVDRDLAIDSVAGHERGRIRGRIAHQVRQDVWRALRTVRGFVPRVTVSERIDGVTVAAGGALLTGSADRPSIEGALRRVLENTANRRRWVHHAIRGTRLPKRK